MTVKARNSLLPWSPGLWEAIAHEPISTTLSILRTQQLTVTFTTLQHNIIIESTSASCFSSVTSPSLQHFRIWQVNLTGPVLRERYAMDEYAELLSRLADDDPYASDSAALLLDFRAFFSPREVLAHFDMISLMITAFCASQHPRWGAIGCLLRSLSNALASNTDELEQRLAVELVNLSRTITETVFATAKTIGSFRPDLFPLANSIIFCFDMGTLHLDLEALLAIADHSVVGFLPRASLIPVLMERLQTAVRVVPEKPALEIYERLARPFASYDSDATMFFLTLWVAMLKQVIESPMAGVALSGQFRALLALSKAPGQHQAAAQVIFRSLVASPKEKAELVAKRQAVIDNACNAMKNRKELDMQVVTEEKVEPKRQQQQVTHKVKVEVLEGKSKKSKNKEWKERVLMLLEQVNLLCWSIDEFMYKKGVAFPCGEIMSVVDIIGKGQDPDLDKEFVVKLVTKKGEFYFAFKTGPEAIQWANMLRSATRAAQS